MAAATAARSATFRFKPFSKRQLKALTWWMPGSPAALCDGIIADGSIRSGKTLSLSLGFVIWSMSSFDGQNFAFCGKTIGSLRRNVIGPLKRMLISRGYTVTDRRASNVLLIEMDGVANEYYLFSGKDEASQDLVQGITLAGVLFDEVALMPESFVNQATGRCSVDGSKFWFNCNPEAPMHWFKRGWIDKWREKNLLYLHFTMDDNLSLSDKVKLRYESMYSGVFHKRYIQGLWCVADGLCYQDFADDPEPWLADTVDLKEVQYISIGVDFGGNRSLTTFVATAVHLGHKRIGYVKDYHIEGRKGDIDADRVCREFVRFVQELQGEFPGVPIRYAFMDSEAQYLINSVRSACRQAGLPLSVGDCHKTEIVQRIIATNTLLSQRRMYVLRRCKLVIGGMRAAAWDSDEAAKGKDVRLDNFSSDIDILDAAEYSWSAFAQRLLPDLNAMKGVS